MESAMASFGTRFRAATVEGLEVFYREAGDPAAPTLVLLHGFPTSSHMFRRLIVDLADSYHLIAPDHIGFGYSDAPAVTEFDYSFDNLTAITLGLLDQLGLDRFALYIQDYGAPIGLRIASRQPQRVTALIVQSGNAYTEGFTPFWDVLFDHAKDRAANEAAVRKLLEPDATRWQYIHGVPTDRLDRLTPDTWTLDQALLDRPGNKEGPAAAVLRLPVQPRRLSRLPGVLPHPPAAHPDHLGCARRDLRRRRRARVYPRPSRRGAPPARRRSLRPGNPRRRDRRTDPQLSRPGMQTVSRAAFRRG